MPLSILSQFDFLQIVHRSSQQVDSQTVLASPYGCRVEAIEHVVKLTIENNSLHMIWRKNMYGYFCADLTCSKFYISESET